jgi:hypothetical protein
MLSLVPMLVMTVPMCLLLGQLGLWYQARPLRVGEEAVVSLQLSENGTYELPELKLADHSAVTAAIGPVRVPSKRLVCWGLQASSPGYYQLGFVMDGQTYKKELVVGDGFMRTSLQRPPRDWMTVLLHPWEEPFAESSPVQSIEIAYPERSSWTAGTNWWVLYWFAASMCAAFLAKPFFNVHI